jgi:hypothetical protein
VLVVVVLVPVLVAGVAAGVCAVDCVVDGGIVAVAGDCVDGVAVALPEVLVDALLDALLDELLAADDEGVVAEGVGVVVAGGLSVSHCQIVGLELTLPETTPPPGVEARACGAMMAATTSPVAVLSKKPRAMRPIADGRTRAKHM